MTMNKNQVASLLFLIETYYPGKLKPEDPDKVVKAWYEILKDQDFENVKARLMRHVKTSRFVPAIADLIEQKSQGPSVPDVQQTRVLLTKMAERQTESKKRERDEIEEAKKEAGRMLQKLAKDRLAKQVDDL